MRVRIHFKGGKTMDYTIEGYEVANFMDFSFSKGTLNLYGSLRYKINLEHVLFFEELPE